MREEIADLVHPVFGLGLQLKDRLERGEALDLAEEQSHLKGLLLSDMAARRMADFGGEIGTETRNASISQVAGDQGRRSSDSFLGVRYALACWLDEIFVDSRWGQEWNGRKIETALYKTNDRAWAFWEQARRAEGRPGNDALEVFFLCVMLGFRGELRQDQGKLQAWITSTQARIAKSQGQEMPFPPELEPPTFVPPRRGRERLQRMILIAAIFIIILIPILAYYVTNVVIKS